MRVAFKRGTTVVDTAQIHTKCNCINPCVDAVLEEIRFMPEWKLLDNLQKYSAHQKKECVSIRTVLTTTFTSWK